MQGNKFYVKQGPGIAPGLEGLAGTVETINARKREEAAIQEQKDTMQAESDRVQGVRNELAQAFADKDINKIQQISIRNESVSKDVNEALKMKFNEGGVTDITNFLKKSAFNPDSAGQNLEELRVRFQQNDGVIDQQEQATLDKYQGVLEGDPKQAQFSIDSDYALVGGKEGIDSLSAFRKLQGTGGKEQSKEYAPSGFKKLITERQQYIDGGLTEEDPIIKGYDAKISGTDIDIENMTDDEVDTWGIYIANGGKLPSLGRGKQSTAIRVRIVKSAARHALGADADGVPDLPDKTPVEAAMSMLGEQADTKSIQGSLNFLDKQLSSMGSFVTNLNSQVDKVSELSKDLQTFDASILNVPLRAVRGRLKGSSLQAKYDMYLTEIENEIGKLATGATGSVTELSIGAQEKWAKIHDKNLSVKKMLELLQETKAAANFRLSSVQGELDKTRGRMRREGRLPPDAQKIEAVIPTTQAEIESMQPGDIFIGPDGKQYRRN